MAERVDEIVPLLPETEFANTVRSVGIEDAGWLVEFASSEQRVAAVDLDCWKDARFSPSRLFEWIDAMIEAGPETLVAAFDELDVEVWVLAMKEMADFSIVGLGEVGAEEAMTDDGMVYYTPHSDEHEGRVREILSTARFDSPSHYWSFVYGAISDSRKQSEAFAARWQRGRLNDLGFPDRDHAMRAYRPLRVDEDPVVDIGPRESSARDTDSAETAIQIPKQLSGSLVGQALNALSATRGAEVLGYVLAVANTLAVADELPLADTESVETSFRKAVRGIDRGLATLAKARNQNVATILDGTKPLDLFRIGATVDPELRRGKTLVDHEEEEDRADWNVETEEVSEEDRTLGDKGRPQ